MHAFVAFLASLVELQLCSQTVQTCLPTWLAANVPVPPPYLCNTSALHLMSLIGEVQCSQINKQETHRVS